MPDDPNVRTRTSRAKITGRRNGEGKEKKDFLRDGNSRSAPTSITANAPAPVILRGGFSGAMKVRAADTYNHLGNRCETISARRGENHWRAGRSATAKENCAFDSRRLSRAALGPFSCIYDTRGSERVAEGMGIATFVTGSRFYRLVSFLPSLSLVPRRFLISC